MRAIVAVESGGDPLAIGDNTTRHSYAPRDRASAIALARTLLARGDNIDVGIGQVNSANFRAYGVDAAAMLEPCANLRAASRILAGDYASAAAAFPNPRQALWAAMSAYNTGSLYAGGTYVAKVVAAASRAPTVPPIAILMVAAAPVLPAIIPRPMVPRVLASRAPSTHTRPARVEPLAAPLTSAGITRTLEVEIDHGHG
jgi:type IV secretion system protein VirB1